jgi:transcriptional regulator with XRE-family HTH domain
MCASSINQAVKSVVGLHADFFSTQKPFPGIPIIGICSQVHSSTSPKTSLTLLAMPKKVPPSSAFGQRLMRLRLAKGLTQTQLADMIESSQRAISRYETIAELPPTPVLVKIAKALNTSADELLGLKKPQTPARPKEDPETRRTWKKFQQMLELPEKDRRAVVRLINSLVAAKQRA